MVSIVNSLICFGLLLTAVGLLQLYVGIKINFVPATQMEQPAPWQNQGSNFQSSRGTAQWIQLVSWEPRLYLYHNFLTMEECDHLKTTAAPFMKRSKVKGDIVIKSRTSYGTYVRRLQDPVIAGIQDKIANWTHLEPVHQENIQVLRYGSGDYYGLHKDVRSDQESPRVMTVVMILSNFAEGGETAFFPGTNYSHASHPLKKAVQHSHNHQCNGATGVAVKPSKGDALLFHSLTPAGEFDIGSFHMGCPVQSGVKWAASVWVHTAPYEVSKFRVPLPGELPSDPGICSDSHSDCRERAAQGWCEKDPDFMKGLLDREGNTGACRESCGVCKKCEAQDHQCYLDNRRAAGFLNIDNSELVS